MTTSRTHARTHALTHSPREHDAALDSRNVRPTSCSLSERQIASVSIPARRSCLPHSPPQVVIIRLCSNDVCSPRRPVSIVVTEKSNPKTRRFTALLVSLATRATTNRRWFGNFEQTNENFLFSFVTLVVDLGRLDEPRWIREPSTRT